MMDIFGWIDVNKQLPEMQPGKFSDPVFILTGEFGQERHVAVVRCWLSSEPGAEPKWSLDNMRSIAEAVTHWMVIPQQLTERISEGGE
jgi:hypothetical protein